MTMAMFVHEKPCEHIDENGNKSGPRFRHFAHLAMKDATVWRKCNLLFQSNGTIVLLYSWEDQAQQHYDHKTRLAKMIIRHE